jgi:hypothetical protein
MYLIRSACCDDQAALQARPELWRRVRRFNLPVQLAVAAAEEVAAGAADPARAALLAFAPCRSGSPELFDAIRALDTQGDGAPLRTPRVNPVVTFHAVDNLALSALAITLGNQAYGLGLGGAAGQGWAALEIAHERLGEGREEEALVVAGEQDAACGSGRGVALLFSRRAAVYPPLGKTARLAAVRRSPGEPSPAEPDAAAGLAALLAEIAALAGGAAPGRWVYPVPAAHGDGRDRLELVWDVT